MQYLPRAYTHTHTLPATLPVLTHLNAQAKTHARAHAPTMEAHAPHSKDLIALPLIHDKASLAGMLRPITTDSEASALLASLCTLRDRVAGHGRVWRADTFTASLRIAREAVGLTDLRELFGAVGRWALAAYDGDVLQAVPVWAPGSGPRTATYTAAQCR